MPHSLRVNINNYVTGGIILLLALNRAGWTSLIIILLDRYVSVCVGECVSLHMQLDVAWSSPKDFTSTKSIQHSIPDMTYTPVYIIMIA